MTTIRSAFFALASAAAFALPVHAAELPAYAQPVSSLKQAISTGRAPRDITKALAKDGAAPVTIKLNLAGGWRPEHLLTSTQVEQQRSVITSAQQIILDKLGGAGIDNTKRYRYVPYLALEATEAALDIVVRMPEVYVVGMDRRSGPTLASSTPVIGADDVVNAIGAGAVGAGQTIAILDTGVDKSHAFFGGRVVSEACFSIDSSWRNTDSLCPGGLEETTAAGSGVNCAMTGCDHGTHVAGIAAGSGSTFSGVAPAATLISINVFHRENDLEDCPAQGSGQPATQACSLAQFSDVLLGLERVYALRGTFNIAAANMSLGTGAYSDQSDCNDDFEDFNDMYALLRGVGIAPTVASGNGAQMQTSLTTTVFVPGIAGPACASNAISVGNVNNANGITASSQVAPFLQLLAPGTGITSSVPGGGFVPKTGTSHAAPHVAGAFAALKSLDPSRSVDDLLSRLQATGLNIADGRMNPAVNTTRIQVDAAVENQTGRPLRPSKVSVANLRGTTLTVNWTDNSISEASFRIAVAPVNTSLVPSRNLVVAANATSVNVVNLTANQAYTITVQSCNAANLCSALTPAFAVRTLNTLPSVPTNLRGGVVTTSSLQVLWNSNSVNPVTSFRLRGTANASGSWLTYNYPASARSASFSNLAPNSAYFFVIQACNADGCSGDSPIATIRTQSAGAPPAAPSNLRLCGSVAFEVCLVNRTTLIWRDNAANEDGYYFEWSIAQVGVPPQQGAWSTIALGPNRTSYSFSPALTPGTNR